MRIALATLIALAVVLGASQTAADQIAPPRNPSTFTVCVIPLGAYDRRLVPVIKRGIEHLYGFTVKVTKPRALPRKAYYKPRRRWRAEKLLDFLDALPDRKTCDAMLGFTRRDVSTTKGKHKDWGVLGLGTLGGPSGVISSYRMRTRSLRKLKRRAVNVVNHELGHVLGLPHFDGASGCLMNDAKGTVRTVDKETGLLCEHSRKMLLRKKRLAIPNHTRFDWKHVLGR